MAQTTVCIQMDEELKQRFEAFCDDVGMSVSTAFTIYAKRVVRNWKIPFEVSGDPFYSETNQKELDRRIARLDAGLGREHELLD